MKINEWLTETVRSFEDARLYFGHGTDNAWDDAVAILLFVLNLPPDTDDSILEDVLSEEQLTKLTTLSDRRIKDKIPVPYLTNVAWFGGLPFYVDERVIIPRSPFAELIEDEFAPWYEVDEPIRILDLCAGSGCIGIAAALQFPDSTVDLVELSDDAIDVAKINIDKHQVAGRVNIIQSDLMDALGDNKYDIIISNPPYVDKEDMDSLPDEFKHEPEMSLAAGDDGLVCVDRILVQAKKHLNPQGVLIVEVGNSQPALMQKYPRLPFVWLAFERGGEGVFLLRQGDL